MTTSELLTSTIKWTFSVTTVLAGKDYYIHNFSPKDDYGYYHPPSALLILNLCSIVLRRTREL